MAPIYSQGTELRTPYGVGVVKREGVKTPGGSAVASSRIELSDWSLADGVKPSLFSFDDTMEVIPPPLEIGCDVTTQYGRGKLTALTSTKATVVLTEWRLAGLSRVTCHLSPKDCYFAKKKLFKELSAVEKIDRANELREEAKQTLSSKDYSKAGALYQQAIFLINTVDNDSVKADMDRAQLIECLIACSNNAAFTGLQLKEYKDVVQHARNSIMLIDAMETKKGGKVNKAFNTMGIDDDKLFVDWRVKSLYYQAQALSRLGEYSDAKQLLSRAIAYAKDGGMEGMRGKMEQLFENCKLREAHRRKKEKEAARKMFKGAKKAKSPTRANGATASASKGATAPGSVSASSPVPSTVPRVPTSAPEPTPEPTESDTTRPTEAEDDDEEEQPFFEQHKEALILTGMLGLLTGAALLLNRRR